MADITVLMSSSPIASHPSTAIIEETIASVRYHLPDEPIIIMQDGVRLEQEVRRADYAQYLTAIQRFADSAHEIQVKVFGEFLHQARMTIDTLKGVNTPFMLFVEHDTPLVDKPIDWAVLKQSLASGITNHIRLHYWEQIHPEHEYLMRGRLSPNLLKCIQWHQRPHLANTRWYENVLNRHFQQGSRTFIEDKIYGPVTCAPWEDYRLTVYDPNGDGKSMQRSRDLNGRSGETKYDMKF